MEKLLASPFEANPPSIISRFGMTAYLYSEARHCTYKWACGYPREI